MCVLYVRCIHHLLLWYYVWLLECSFWRMPHDAEVEFHVNTPYCPFLMAWKPVDFWYVWGKMWEIPCYIIKQPMLSMLSVAIIKWFAHNWAPGSCCDTVAVDCFFWQNFKPSSWNAQILQTNVSIQTQTKEKMQNKCGPESVLGEISTVLDVLGLLTVLSFSSDLYHDAYQQHARGILYGQVPCWHPKNVTLNHQRPQRNFEFTHLPGHVWSKTGVNHGELKHVIMLNDHDLVMSSGEPTYDQIWVRRYPFLRAFLRSHDFWGKGTGYGEMVGGHDMLLYISRCMLSNYMHQIHINCICNLYVLSS